MTNSIKMKPICRVIISLLIALLIVSVSAPDSMAASRKTVKSTTYYNVVVNGNYAYCIARKGIYKVNLKSGAKKLIAKNLNSNIRSDIYSMKIYKGYLYYSGNGDGIYTGIYRVKLSGKGNKEIALGIGNYAIYKGHIYYSTYKGSSNNKVITKRASLNGRNKTKSRYRVKMVSRLSNKPGYSVQPVSTGTDYGEYDEEYGYEIINHYTDYLVTPSGKEIELCSYDEAYYN